MSKTIKKPVNVDMCGGELQNWKLQNLTTAPTGYTEGMCYMDSTNHIPKYHNGNGLVEFGRIYTNGNGIAISAQNVISVNLSSSDIPSITLSKISDVTASASELNILDGATLTTTELNYVDGVTSAIQTQIDNKVTKNTSITGATKCKITYDSKGLVTGGANLSASDIPDISSTYLAVSLKGANNGVASLGSDGKVPNSQLPSFVDDVIDAYIVSGATALSSGWLSATSGGSALTPETGKIYVILSSGTYLNKTYRWSGTTYVEISASPGNATESAAGIAEIATTSEVTTGTDDTRIVTPLKLAGKLNGYQTSLTFSTGLTNTSGTITVTDYANLLKNTATGTGALTIGGVGSSVSRSINIGYRSKCETNNSGIAIGVGMQGGSQFPNGAIASGEYSIAIGSTSGTSGTWYQSIASGTHSIQIGQGTNSSDYTLCVGFNDNNYQLLDGTTGLIPDERISSTIKNGAAAGATAVQKFAVNNTALTASGGGVTWSITNSLATSDVQVAVYKISTGEQIFPAVTVSQSSPYGITIEMLASANVAADTYRAVVMG